MMVELEIMTERLKAIRKGRKIGRPKLARQIGLTERQLIKLETSTTAVLSEVVVSRISETLQIPSMTLTGEFPLSEGDLQPVLKPKCTSGCCS
ncbi:MAG: helix-turn-helix transcriptional regulator [Planktomarina sp.]|nr:helix-turn-helix transcriptional regulator [Planktomarina sp.]